MAGVSFVWVIDSIRVVAFDVGEVEEDFVVLGDVGSDLVVSLAEVASDPGAIEMAGHIYEVNVGVLVFKVGHGLEILVDHGALGLI